jgi:hypothetical protein
VAPNRGAQVFLLGAGSTTTTWLAPDRDAPCTAFMPTPPAPITSTTSPGRTSAAVVADPNPVCTPQATTQIVLSGSDLSTLTREISS